VAARYPRLRRLARARKRGFRAPSGVRIETDIIFTTRGTKTYSSRETRYTTWLSNNRVRQAANALRYVTDSFSN
jgi:hypothetical protein